MSPDEVYNLTMIVIIIIAILGGLAYISSGKFWVGENYKNATDIQWGLGIMIMIFVPIGGWFFAEYRLSETLKEIARAKAANGNL